jgi:hypothetical protein
MGQSISAAIDESTERFLALADTVHAVPDRKARPRRTIMAGDEISEAAGRRDPGVGAAQAVAHIRCVDAPFAASERI